MPSSFRLQFGLLALVSLAGMFASPVSQACDTPVYRYAMYRWQPTPYELYYFHREKLTDEATKIREQVNQASGDQKNRANIVFLPVDLEEDKELNTVPADVKAAWLAQEKPQTPSFMLVTPRGVQVYHGGLEADDVAKLLESPARSQFAKLLEQGSTGAFLFLDGKDAEASNAAYEVAKTVAADVEAGNIKLYSGAIDMFPDAPGAGAGSRQGGGKEGNSKPSDGPATEGKAQGDKAPKHKLGMIRIARDDQRELWLRRSLMSSERDLEKYADEPMLFAVYDRGRALPAYIGDGISRDNLIEILYFISGACSCTVKEQNPGVDLLVRHDWERAAQKLGEMYGSEEGNDKFGVENMFPSLVFGAPAGESEAGEDPDVAAQADAIIAAQQAKKDAASFNTSANDTAPTDKDDSATTTTVPDEKAGANNKNTGSADEQPDAASGASSRTTSADSADRQVALNDNKANGSHANGAKSDEGHASDLAKSASQTMFYTLAVGLGLAVFVLVSATLLLYRPK